MPRDVFLAQFPGNETNVGWADELIASGEPYAPAIRRNAVDLRRAQRKLSMVVEESGLSLSEIKDINRRMTMGEVRARRAKKKWWKLTSVWLFPLPRSTPTVGFNSWILSKKATLA